MTKTAEEKIRCTTEERVAWAAAAERDGISRAEFIRRAANAAAETLPTQDAVEVYTQWATENGILGSGVYLRRKADLEAFQEDARADQEAAQERDDRCATCGSAQLCGCGSSRRPVSGLAGRACRHNRAPGKFCPVCDK